MIKYDERIPEGRSRSPFRYRDERLYSEFLKSRRNAKFNPQGYGESSQSGYPSHPEPTALSVSQFEYENSRQIWFQFEALR